MLRRTILAVLLLALVAPARGESPGSPPPDYEDLSAPQAEAPRAFLPMIMGPGTPSAPPAPPSSSLTVTTATYLGAAGADALSGAAIAPDGSVLVAGTLPGYAPAGAESLTIGAGGAGALVRLSPDGRIVRSITRLGGSVSDLEVNDAGSIVACGDFGVAVLGPDARAAAWSAAPGNASRCAIGSDGTVAVLVGNQVTTYGAGGAQLGTWPLPGVNNVSATAYDVAVDGALGSVFATGFAQVNSQLQLPYLRAFAYDGTLKWRSYDFPSAPGLGADTRGERLAVGRDGKLYLAGSINGGTGASVFSRDPKDLNVQLGGRLITTDNFNNPFNIGSVKMSWFGRFNPADGTLEQAQSLLTRLSSGRGNSISIQAIAADASGRVFIAGDTACCIRDRATVGVSGITAGSYEGGEGYVLVVSADFRTRLAWTVFAAPGRSAGGSPMTAIAARDGAFALVGTLNPSATSQRGLITVSALQGAEAGGSEGYLVVAPMP